MIQNTLELDEASSLKIPHLDTDVHAHAPALRSSPGNICLGVPNLGSNPRYLQVEIEKSGSTTILSTNSDEPFGFYDPSKLNGLLTQLTDRILFVPVTKLACDQNDQEDLFVAIFETKKPIGAMEAEVFKSGIGFGISRLFDKSLAAMRSTPMPESL